MRPRRSGGHNCPSDCVIYHLNPSPYQFNVKSYVVCHTPGPGILAETSEGWRDVIQLVHWTFKGGWTPPKLGCEPLECTTLLVQVFSSSIIIIIEIHISRGVEFKYIFRRKNVGLCTGGFCPNTSEGITYSCLPDFLRVYNLPPSIAFKHESIQTSFHDFENHDCHVFMQRLLLLAIRGFVTEEVYEAVTKICTFFRVLCSKTLDLADLSNMKRTIVQTTCKLERIFPSSLFSSMEPLYLFRSCVLPSGVSFVVTSVIFDDAPRRCPLTPHLPQLDDRLPQAFNLHPNLRASTTNLALNLHPNRRSLLASPIDEDGHNLLESKAKVKCRLQLGLNAELRLASTMKSEVANPSLCSSKLQLIASDALSLSVIACEAPTENSSGIACILPPRSTVSTADSQTCQFPVHRRPTAPFTGFTVRPQDSNSKD
ncbi:hypothetical protein LXL04_038477 [Taraxacum kok-saghyz]